MLKEIYAARKTYTCHHLKFYHYGDQNSFERKKKTVD